MHTSGAANSELAPADGPCRDRTAFLTIHPDRCRERPAKIGRANVEQISRSGFAGEVQQVQRAASVECRLRLDPAVCTRTSSTGVAFDVARDAASVHIANAAAPTARRIVFIVTMIAALGIGHRQRPAAEARTTADTLMRALYSIQ